MPQHGESGYTLQGFEGLDEPGPDPISYSCEEEIEDKLEMMPEDIIGMQDYGVRVHGHIRILYQDFQNA